MKRERDLPAERRVLDVAAWRAAPSGVPDFAARAAAPVRRRVDHFARGGHVPRAARRAVRGLADGRIRQVARVVISHSGPIPLKDNVRSLTGRRGARRPASDVESDPAEIRQQFLLDDFAEMVETVRATLELAP